MTESLFYRFGSFPKVAALPHQIKGLVPLLAWIEPAAGFLKGGPRTTTTFFVGVVKGLPDVSPLPNELRLFWPTAMLQFVATEGKLRWVAFATDAEELKPPVKADPVRQPKSQASRDAKRRCSGAATSTAFTRERAPRKANRDRAVYRSLRRGSNSGIAPASLPGGCVPTRIRRSPVASAYAFVPVADRNEGTASLPMRRSIRMGAGWGSRCCPEKCAAR